MEEKNPFIIKDSKIVYQNPWIKVREDSVIRPGGKDGTFGIVDMKDGVTIIALDSEKNVYLTLEYAYAIGRHSLECISGGIDDKENVVETAKRELKEEIGGISNEWIDLGKIDPFTSVVKSVNHIYLAKNVTIDFAQNTDEGEVIHIIKVPFNDAYAKVISGEITHGASVVALFKTHILLNQ